ncbi:MAG: DUF3127 domain-containing protein [Flavobacteriales bacterium]|nr:DUF3127 domain-containing protein [Flavobacteriales bacterium]
MKITAIVTDVLEIQSGTNKAGKEWKKQGVLVKQLNDFKGDLLIEFWNDNILEFEKGRSYIFNIIVESREWNGKYFTNVSCNSVSPDNENPF